MAKEKGLRLDYHLKFNGRNSRHVSSARVLASVDMKYKSSFVALAIEHYMDAHPMGISLEELRDIYRQSDRTYKPKAPISENLLNGVRKLREAPAIQRDKGPGEDAETSSAIDKAMNYYDIT